MPFNTKVCTLSLTLCTTPHPTHSPNTLTNYLISFFFFPPTTTTQSLFKGIRTSKFRHVYGDVARKDQCYENINITKNAHDNNFCAVNPKVSVPSSPTAGRDSIRQMILIISVWFLPSFLPI